MLLSIHLAKPQDGDERVILGFRERGVRRLWLSREGFAISRARNIEQGSQRTYAGSPKLRCIYVTDKNGKGICEKNRLSSQLSTLKVLECFDTNLMEYCD